MDILQPRALLVVRSGEIVGEAASRWKTIGSNLRQLIRLRPKRSVRPQIAVPNRSTANGERIGTACRGGNGTVRAQATAVYTVVILKRRHTIIARSNGCSDALERQLHHLITLALSIRLP